MRDEKLPKNTHVASVFNHYPGPRHALFLSLTSTANSIANITLIMRLVHIRHHGLHVLIGLYFSSFKFN